MLKGLMSGIMPCDEGYIRDNVRGRICQGLKPCEEGFDVRDNALC